MTDWGWMPPLDGEGDAPLPPGDEGLAELFNLMSTVGRGKPLYYARDGTPMSMRDWSVRFDDLEYKRVGRTEVAEGVEVSTVWLGLDHNFYAGPPLIFETMVFGGPLDETQERYATEAEARRGHEHWVTFARHAQEMAANDEAHSQLTDDEQDPDDYGPEGEL